MEWEHKEKYINWRIQCKHGEIKSQMLVNIHPTGIKQTIKVREGKKIRQVTSIVYPPQKQFIVVKT